MGTVDTYTIKKATKRDLKKLIPIFENARRFMIVMGNPEQWGDHYPTEEIILQDIVDKHCYLVLDVDKTLLGTFCLIDNHYAPYDHIYNGNWLDTAPYVHLHRIASAGVRGGFAMQVLAWCQEQYEHIRIDTHRQNMQMRRALMAQGFKLCGTVDIAEDCKRIAFQWNRPVDRTV